ncbi:PKD domain-containing protein [Pedobacter nyackensis]|uniref:Gliding motility-associated C-terminal domain-containing protein n=1 Tax=Pedobacter nyackensis TaxID=475255 RepID=A0A1W2AQW6_9SPHI|nr:PKD domain-containing protein [Pedobacter nyackensis]SMC63139.1 gliding motility-associated C-terminal domain-containing protein [Pedobacter nyackensis]
MYRWVFIIWAFLFFPFVNAEAQNTSNKGKEFWIAYTGHIDGATSKMYLYITSDVNTTADVRIGGLPVSGSPFLITANQVQGVSIDPAAYIGSSDVKEIGKAIQVIAEKPVVVYSHIFKAARSAATLVLPTKVLGREYYTTNYIQNKQGGNNPGPAYSQFTIVAVEDNTLVEITPKANERNGRHNAGQTFQVPLNKGEIYQYQSDTDLSASHIISIASASGLCKPIAVFSGSSWVGFCNDLTPSGNGGDNLYQQLYPITAWGKEFITAPFIHKPYDIFRIYFSKDNTSLTINGVATNPATFNKGTFYEFTAAQANSIVASEPISVVQYQISQTCDPDNVGIPNNTPVPHPGDPEMTVLNPVEQTLNKITVYSALRSQTVPPTNITQHYINIIIKDEFKASFTVNGLAPEGTFVPIGSSGYSYLQEDVTARSTISATHTLMADGGFSAIAYGYGNVESYGYLAGADAKNLYQNLQIFNATTRVERTDVCAGETAAFTLVLPYQPTSITWTIDGIVEAPILNPTFNSSEVINGTTVYKYNYRQDIPFVQPSAHEVKVTMVNPTPSGCDPNEEIIVDFEVFDLPTAKFSSSNGQTCAGVPITLTDESIPNGKNIARWFWDFGDGKPLVERRNAAPFEYIYTSSGDYNITMWVESESGCASIPTTPIAIHVNKLPQANFRFTTPSCETRNITFTDQSVANEGVITKWYWKFGDVNATVANPNESTAQYPVHVFSQPGTYTISLIVETDKGCSSIAVEQQLVINRLPVVDFDTPDACVSDVAVMFNNKSTNADGTTAGLTYLWNFGDSPGPLNTSTNANGTHKYNAFGDYTVTLTITSAEGCSVTLAKPFRVNGATPSAAFQVLNENNLCSNRDLVVNDESAVLGFGNLTKLEWYIDGEKVSEKRNPLSNDTYALNYPAFTSPLTKIVELKLIAYSGDVQGPCYNIATKTITLHAAPVVKFDALAPVCVNVGKIQIIAEETGNIPGQGVFTGQGVSPAGLFDPARVGVGTWDITYTFTGDNQCADQRTQSIVVKPIPKVNIASDLYAFIDGTIQVNASVTESDLRFKWSPSKGLNRDDILNPVITADDDRVYTLTVTSSLNCDETVRVNLHVLRTVVPPNAFSPNGDGVNDVWILNHLESYPNATVDIFNRYGEKVFLSQGYSIPFDGNYKGKPLPVGTYYYMINPKNGRKSVTGSLTLVR